MGVVYRFRKERLQDGGTVARPKIPVRLSWDAATVDVVALIDSGCDVTVIPQSLAEAIGVSTTGTSQPLVGFREESAVVEAKVDITFLGRRERQETTLHHVPVLVVLRDDRFAEETEIVLGLAKVFDEFDITFRRSRNRIELKASTRPR
ncbi:MAG: aspartyl protease family protein [Deltaproteobacteria bacterium]|nr:aspartyl protease family protein [Deltaproteobacteria bacterium]